MLLLAIAALAHAATTKPTTKPAKPAPRPTTTKPPTTKPAGLTPAAIDAAIAKAKAFVYAQQKDDGTWEASPAATQTTQPKKPAYSDAFDINQYGGRTALAVYTLLRCDEPATEPKLQKAIQFLHTAPIQNTFGLALKCHVWSHLPQTAEVKKSLRRDASLLLSYRKMNTKDFVVWDYQATDPEKPKTYSLQSTQYAAWGLAAAADAEFEVPTDVWKGIEKTFTAGQTPDGAWRNRFEGDYAKSPDLKAKPLSLSMTASSLAALQLALDFTRVDAQTRGNPSSPPVDKAMAWIARNYDQPPVDKGELPESQARRLYGLGQVALAAGLRRIGNHDWYNDGCKLLIDKQGKDGSLAGGNAKLMDTCWALIFLHRGRVPVAFDKLDYVKGADDPKTAFWNQRPRDAANVTRWVSRATERDLRWQVVDAGESIDNLLEAPVLYLAGGDALSLKPELTAKLKTYVESGGLIFAAPDAGNPPFVKSVEKLGLDLCPGNEWRDVPDTHPILATQMFKRNVFVNKPPLRAIGNGVREFVVLVPSGDPGKIWQQRAGRVNPDAWMLAADVLSYATDKSHFNARGETWLVRDAGGAPKHTVRVGRLKYNGPWNPEPLAFTQLARYGKTRDWDVKTVTIEVGQPVKDVDVLYVTGTTALSFDDATRDAVKAYLDNGGRVIFEAAGGGDAFAAGAQAELARWYGADALKLLPASHAIYAGDKLPIAYRGYNSGSIDRPTEPRLLGVEKDGKLVAVLSRDDLSAGLLGVPTDGITGYTPPAARALLLRVLTRWK